MAKPHDENFSQLLEEAKLMIAQQGRNRPGIRSVLKHMNLSEDENNPDLYAYISNRRLAKMLGIDSANPGSDVFNVRKDLRDKRLGNEVDSSPKVDSSRTEYMGSGDEFVYLYYFRTYKQYAESEGLNYWQCNIGYTEDSPEERVASQIGGQLPEKATLSLVMQTNDCKKLEKLIHCELKRREQWLNPEAGADVIGEEWFSTNPAEVKDIFRYLQAKQFCDEFKDPSPEDFEEMDKKQFEELKRQYQKKIRNCDIVKEYESKN